MSPSPRAAANGIMGDVRGGLAGAAFTLGGLLPISLIAFGMLGPDVASHAIRAAFVSVIVGNAVAALVGGTPISGTTARTSATLVFAGLVTSLAAEGLDIATIVMLSTLATLCAGVLQVGFGLVRAGSQAKYVPLPVVVGFIDGLALLIIVGQLPALMGVVGRGVGVFDALPDLQWGALVLGLSMIVGVHWVTLTRPSVPGLLVFMLLGTFIYLTLQHFFPNWPLGPQLAAPRAELPLPDGWLPFMQWPWPASIAAHATVILTTGVVIAVVSSLDSLMSAAAAENETGLEFNGNRLLIGQGLANVASSAFGGLPVVHGGAFAIAAARAGGHSRWCAVSSSLSLLAILLFGGTLLGKVPIAVTAGVMIGAALGLFDRWTPLAVRRLWQGARAPDLRWSVAIVVVVCLVTFVFGFVAAVVLGIALSMLLFVTGLNRSLIRGTATGRTRASRRIYPTAQAALLHEYGDATRLFTLEGAIFFGTAETLREEVHARSQGARFVILDLARVTAIDPSGVTMVDRLAQQLKEAGTTLLLAGIVDGDRHAQALHTYSAKGREERLGWFTDADKALEFAEETTLATVTSALPDVELTLAELPLLEGLSGDDCARVGALLARVSFEPGQRLFLRGNPGDRLYMMARGAVSLVEGTGADRSEGRRIVSFNSGVVFGETAMLDGGPRTATAIAETDAVAYTLSRVDLDHLRAEQPALAAQLLYNLARQLSGRLRFATLVLWAGEDRAEQP